MAIAGMASHKRLPWRCKVCGKRNGPNDVKCLGCRRPKPEPKPEPKLPKPKPKPKLRELETQLFARRGGKGLAAPSRRAIARAVEHAALQAEIRHRDGIVESLALTIGSRDLQTARHLVRLLRRCKSDDASSVVQNTCRSLLNLCARDAAACGAAGAVEELVAVAAATRREWGARAEEYACTALAALVADRDNKQRAHEAGGVAAIMSVLVRHGEGATAGGSPRAPHAVAAALRLLQCMTNYDHALARFAGEQGLVPALVHVLRGPLQRHAHVVEPACRALFCLVDIDRANALQASEAGLSEALIAVLDGELRRSAAVQEAACGALSCICAVPANRPRAQAAGAARAAAAAQSGWPGRDSKSKLVRQKAASVIRLLQKGDPRTQLTQQRSTGGAGSGGAGRPKTMRWGSTNQRKAGAGPPGADPLGLRGGGSAAVGPPAREAGARGRPGKSPHLLPELPRPQTA